MTPHCDRILESYCVYTRWMRRSPNVIIINPAFELKILAEMIESDKCLNIYNGLKIIHSEDIEQFQLAFMMEE